MSRPEPSFLGEFQNLALAQMDAPLHIRSGLVAVSAVAEPSRTQDFTNGYQRGYVSIGTSNLPSSLRTCHRYGLLGKVLFEPGLD